METRLSFPRDFSLEQAESRGGQAVRLDQFEIRGRGFRIAPVSLFLSLFHAKLREVAHERGSHRDAEMHKMQRLSETAVNFTAGDSRNLNFIRAAVTIAVTYAVVALTVRYLGGVT